MSRPARVRMDADERERSTLEIARAVQRLNASCNYGSADVTAVIRAALILANRNDIARKLDTP